MVKIRRKMSRKGLKHWSRGARKRVYRYTFSCLGVRHMPLEVAEHRKDFAEWLYREFGYGYFYVFTWHMKKPKKGGKAKPTPYLLATIEIEKKGDRFIPHFIDITRLRKQPWFESKLRIKL